MKRLKRWTIFYPEKKKEISISSKLDTSLQEHWQTLMTSALENKIANLNYEQYQKRTKINSELKYQDFLLSCYMKINIPVLQYIEIGNTCDWCYILRLPEDLSLLNEIQLKELNARMKALRKIELKSHVIVAVYQNEKNEYLESNLNELSASLYHVLYGGLFDMKKSEEISKSR